MTAVRLILGTGVILLLAMPPTKAAKIVGRVLDLDGMPISGATIRVLGQARSIDADSTGDFTLSDLPPDRIEIKVSALGFETTTLKLSLNADEIQSLRFNLESRPWRIGDIRVSANRVGGRAFDEPRSVSFVGKHDLETRQMSTLADGLAFEPGITVQKTTHGHGSPVIGGLVGNYVLLSYDGIRLNKSTFRFGPNQYLNSNDFDGLDRIEIVAGPTSVIHGSDAIGGSINLVRKSQFGQTNVLEIAPSFTSRYSTADDGVRQSMRVNIANERVSLCGGATVAKYGDLHAGGDIGDQTPTGWDEFSLYGSAAIRISNRVTMTGSHMSVRQEDVPRYDKYYDGGNDKYLYDPQDRDLSSLALDASRVSSFLDSLHMDISYQKETEGITEQRTSSYIIRKSFDEVSTIGVSGHALTQLNTRHSIVYGAEYYRDGVKSQRYEDDGIIVSSIRSTFPDGASFASFGLFLEDRWQLTDRTDVIVGLRYSRFHLSADLEHPFGDYNDEFDDLTGSVSLVRFLGKHQNIYASVARGFRAPNLDDAVVLRTTNTGMDAPSTLLVPEESYYVEIGSKYERQSVSSSVSVIGNWMRDLIDREPGYYLGLPFYDENSNGVRDSGELEIFQKKNTGESQLFGALARLAWEFRPFWLLKLHGSWHYGENTSSGESLSRIPPAAMYIALSHEMNQNFSGEIFARAAVPQTRLSARDRGDSRIGPNGTPGWFTINLSATYIWRSLRGSILLENLLDEKYRTHGSGIYAPGRSVSVCIIWN